MRGRGELGEVDLSEFSPQTMEAWREAAGKALAPRGAEPVRGEAFDKRMRTRTYEGIVLEPLYTAEDTKGLRAARTFPGVHPLRGDSAAGSLGRPWEIAQPCEETDPAKAHEALRHELERGATTATFRLDRGLGAEQLGTILAGMTSAPLHVYAGESAMAALEALEAQSAKEGVQPSALRGCVGADPLGALLETGGLSRPLDDLWDDVARSIRWADEKGASLRTIMIRAGAVARDGGASAVQEASCAVASAVQGLRAMLGRGLSVDGVAARIRFVVSQGAEIFMEIAKIRAMRRVWARVVEAFGGSPSAQRSEVFATTSSFTKTVYDPYVNMLRNATEAFSAVVGGAEGLTAVPFDEALRPASELSRRQARNSLVMLQREFDLGQPVDPAGGSWYIESLTDELARATWAALQKIEAQGGFLASIEQGLIQKDVEATLASRFKDLAKRSARAVGTNMYPNVQERPAWADVPRRDPTPPASPAVTVDPIRPRRWTEQFEALRRRTEEHVSKGGENVEIFLANMGPIPQHKARADFITSFMEVAAFDVLRDDGHATVDECAEAAVASGAPVVVICSTDATYPEIVPPLTRAIKAKAGDVRVYLAGEPAADHKEAYEQAGLDGAISVRSNCLEVLEGLQKMRGMM